MPGDEPPPRTTVPVQPDATIGRMAKGSGTGFFVNETGMVLTNFHVAGSCGVITVTGYDRRPVVARVAASAAPIDLLLLSTSTTPPAVAPFSRDPARAPTDRALLVGFSLKGHPTATATPSNARIRPADLGTDGWRVMFNGRAYPGHSGSPLLNQFGEVVAVVHARATSKTTLAGGAVETHSGLAVSMRATRQFLSDSKVSFHPGPAEKTYSDEQILERARRFVVRVQCWS
ncbi:MAG: trypsin-like peptidase domain-containing protein [Alphaproteobacteria bacterium]|nr:trypsin-like peptidase domain-containing protein [Alphaproteobacteria bacterium]